MKRAFLYTRVSTSEQVSGYSIDEQIERLQAYCTAKNWIVARIYNDGGFSGGNTDRPALKDMIHDIKHCDVVLVYKLDRLSRSQKDTLELIEDVFLKNNVDFVSISENFDTGTPFGRAMIGILAVFAQLEREQIKERTHMGREGRAKEGKYHGGGENPIGYDYVNGELVINDFEAMQIREMHDLYQSGMSVKQIERIFEEKGYKHKHGKWRHDRINYVLKNDLYCGVVTFAGVKIDGTHTPIISKETFNKTKQIMNSYDYSSSRNKGKRTLLGGLLYCKRCGARYGLTIFTDKKYNKEYRYYSCYSRRKLSRSMIRDPNCKNKIWRTKDLDEIILGEIRKLSLEPSQIETKTGSDNKSDIIRKELARIDRQRSRLLYLYQTEQYTIEELNAVISPLNTQKQRLENELSNQRDIEDVRQIITSFDEVIKAGTCDQVRIIINALIDKIELDGEDVYIHWSF